MRQFFLPVLSGLLLFSCSPKIVSKKTAALPPLAGHEAFVIFSEKDSFAANATAIGSIAIKDAGLSVNCSYEAVVQLAEKQARQMGANCLRIYEHRLPGAASTCHRIKAMAYYLADVTPFEKEIVWHRQRRLRKEDFKGSTDERPFAAATNSGIRCRYAGSRLQGKVALTVEAFFDCGLSYFKPSDRAAEILEHEQGHFDLAEVYARRLAKLAGEQIRSARSIEAVLPGLHRQVMKEMQTEQDRYDSDVYRDRTTQQEWLLNIRQQLQELSAYENKELLIAG